MSLATEKLKQTSERFVLVRMEPARYIGADLVSQGGGIYQASFEYPYDVSKIQRNGSNLTKVTTLAGNDQYTVSDDKKTIRLQLASAPNVSSNVIVLFHYLYLTTERGRYFPVDPISAESASNPLRYWEPRIQRSPSVEESFRNIINGVFTIKASSLSVNNHGSWANPYLSKEDTFKNKVINIYIGINDALDQLYSGPINNISIRDNTCQIDFRDAFSKLNELATYGLSPDDMFFSKLQSGFGRLDPKFEGKPKTFVIGKGCPGRHIPVFNVIDTASLYDADKKYAHTGFFNEAVNIDYSPTVSSTNNDLFFLCRSGNTEASQQIGSLVRRTTSTIRGDTVHHFFFSDHNLKVGQTFKWDDGSGPYYAIVHHVGNHTISSNTYNVMVGNNSNLNLTDPQMTSAAQFEPLDSIVVVYRPGSSGGSSINTVESPVYLKLEEQYTLSRTLSGGIYTYTIDVDGSLFNIVPGPAGIDPASGDQIFWQIEFADNNTTHNEVIRSILNRLNIDNNATSFTNVGTAYSAFVRMQIPMFGDSSIPTYRDIIERICSSALTFLYQDKLGRANYGLLSSISSGSVRNQDVILSGSQSVGYEYNDIYQRISYTNRHANYQNNEQQYQVVSRNKSIYLHGEDRSLQFEHVLDDISTRINDHLEIKSSRQATYAYNIATEDIDSQLGDDITLESDKITSSGSQNVKITSIVRSPDRIQVKATDLGDLV